MVTMRFGVGSYVVFDLLGLSGVGLVRRWGGDRSRWMVPSLLGSPVLDGRCVEIDIQRG
jgi:hypothetical protein